MTRWLNNPLIATGIYLAVLCLLYACGVAVMAAMLPSHDEDRVAFAPYDTERVGTHGQQGITEQGLYIISVDPCEEIKAECERLRAALAVYTGEKK